MIFNICSVCDGTGERDTLSGAKCYECNGTGFCQDVDPDDEEYDDDDDYVWPEEQKRQDAMERGDYLRDRAKDEEAERKHHGT